MDDHIRNWLFIVTDVIQFVCVIVGARIDTCIILYVIVRKYQPAPMFISFCAFFKAISFICVMFIDYSYIHYINQM